MQGKVAALRPPLQVTFSDAPTKRVLPMMVSFGPARCPALFRLHPVLGPSLATCQGRRLPHSDRLHHVACSEQDYANQKLLATSNMPKDIVSSPHLFDRRFLRDPTIAQGGQREHSDVLILLQQLSRQKLCSFPPQPLLLPSFLCSACSHLGRSSCFCHLPCRVEARVLTR